MEVEDEQNLKQMLKHHIEAEILKRKLALRLLQKKSIRKLVRRKTENFTQGPAYRSHFLPQQRDIQGYHMRSTVFTNLGNEQIASSTPPPFDHNQRRQEMALGRLKKLALGTETYAKAVRTIFALTSTNSNSHREEINNRSHFLEITENNNRSHFPESGHDNQYQQSPFEQASPAPRPPKGIFAENYSHPLKRILSAENNNRSHLTGIQPSCENYSHQGDAIYRGAKIRSHFCTQNASFYRQGEAQITAHKTLGAFAHRSHFQYKTGKGKYSKQLK